MRLKTAIFLLLIVFSCDESSDPQELRLTRIEATSYDGYIMQTAYGYDMQGRISTITQYRDDDEPTVKVNITYDGNEATLLSYLDFDPSYNQTKKVVLTLNERGLTQKRIEYTEKVNSNMQSRPVEGFIYDTLLFEYDAAGLLSKTMGSRYDSTSLMNPSAKNIRRVISNSTYTVEAGNLSAIDELIVYTVNSSEGSSSTISGGTSERHKLFHYTQSYPNKTDFTNAAILNEYMEYHEAFLNPNYNHMPDQVLLRTIDRDINGDVFFSFETITEMERDYNGYGMLSSVRIPTNVQYTEVKYFYR